MFAVSGALLHKSTQPSWWAACMSGDRKKRGKYRTTNWAQYNAALKARGSLAQEMGVLVAGGGVHAAFSSCLASGFPLRYQVARLMPMASQGFERVSALAKYSALGNAQ
jgi:hypothetical protein